MRILTQCVSNIVMKSKTKSSCHICRQRKRKCNEKRPCSRCIRLGLAVDCLRGTDTELIVERPVAQSSKLAMCNDTSSAFKIVCMNPDFSRFIAMTCAAGYEAINLWDMFDRLPPKLMRIVIESLAAQNFKQNFSPIPNCPDIIGDSSSVLEGATAPHHQPAQEPGTIEISPEWETDQVFGYFQVHFDVTTMRRLRLYMNSQFARVYGYHKEELMARFAFRNTEFNKSQWDALLILLHLFPELSGGGPMGTVERYSRIINAGGGPHAASTLVWYQFSSGPAGDGAAFTVRRRPRRAAPFPHSYPLRPKPCSVVGPGPRRAGLTRPGCLFRSPAAAAAREPRAPRPSSEPLPGRRAAPPSLQLLRAKTRARVDGRAIRRRPLLAGDGHRDHSHGPRRARVPARADPAPPAPLAPQ